jgi:hypothetical protein
MNKPLLEKRLKLYKKNKYNVETTVQRVNLWEGLLREGNLEIFEYQASRLLGMPRAKNVNGLDVIVAENEVTEEMVRDWIEDDKSRIYYMKIEVEQIETALKALSQEQSVIVDLKYFNNMSWRGIETIFNERFKNRIYITDEMLRKMNRESLQILWDLLGPLYARLCYGLAVS